MNRWWADADQARVILDRVDDSDVVQGVGTAVLGYHALAAGVLKPLSERTLVDTTVIRDALDEVDLEPVAKALAEATRPVMGDASDVYGELLAMNLHEQAVEATSRFVTGLTNTGVDWPSAVSRAADIHGVPLDRLGLAGEKLRGPRLAPIAQQDYADRVLVGYASHVGHREADGTVSKAMRMRSREFDEDDVQRDRLGRFAVQAESTVAPTATRRDFQAYREARKRKADKRAKRTPRLGLQVSHEEATVTAAPAAAVVAEQADSKKEQRQADRKERRKADRKTRREEARKARRAQARKLLDALNAKPPQETEGGSMMQPLPNEPRHKDGLFLGNRMRVQSERYFLLPDWVANEVMHSGGFNVGKLVLTRPIPHPTAMTEKELQATLNDMSDLSRMNNRPENSPGRMVIVRMVGGEIAFAEDADNHTEGVFAELASGSTYAVQPDHAMDYDDDDFELDLTDFTYRPNPAKKMPMRRSITVKLNNGSEFDYNDMDPKRDDFDYDVEDTPPLPYDSDWAGGKSADWDENEVRRDRRGRFAREGHGKLVSVSSDKAERIRAYQEAKARKAKRRARRASDRIGLQVAPEAPKLSTLAAEQAAPVASLDDRREQRRAERKERRQENRRSARVKRIVAQRMLARRQALREGHGVGRAEWDLRDKQVAFPSDDQVALLMQVGDTGGTYEEGKAFEVLAERLVNGLKAGPEAVGILDATRTYGAKIAATPTYETPVPVFDTQSEAENYALKFLSDAFEAYDNPSKNMLTRRIMSFLKEADELNTVALPTAEPHRELDGKWVPKLEFDAPPESMPTALVGSPQDWRRLAAGQVPRFVVDDPAPLAGLALSTGIDSERVSQTQDANVQVIRMRFVDNVEH